MTASEEIGLGRIQENEKISNALITSIFTGHLMFSSTPREQVIREFTDRISRIPESSCAAPTPTEAKRIAE